MRPRGHLLYRCNLGFGDMLKSYVTQAELWCHWTPSLMALLKQMLRSGLLTFKKWQWVQCIVMIFKWHWIACTVMVSLLHAFAVPLPACIIRISAAVPAIKSFSTTSDGPPKRPKTSYLHFVQQQWPVVSRQHPGEDDCCIAGRAGL